MTAILLVIAINGWVAYQDAASQPPRCSFQVSPDRPEPEIVADAALRDRIRVMSQPDSPLAIIRVDLTGLQFQTSPGFFERSGTHVVEVRNVSDQSIAGAEVTVLTVIEAHGSVGTGNALNRPLNPGEQARIAWKSGAGRGTMPTTEEATLVALVTAVRTKACTYKPSQTWPPSERRGFSGSSFGPDAPYRHDDR